MPADDYPTLPASPSQRPIDGHVFTQAVAQVSVAADRGDTLPILTGVRVEIEGDTMTLLATDRYRLAMRELNWNPAATDASHVVLIPARTLSDTASSSAPGLDRRRPRHRRGGDGLSASRPGNAARRRRLLDGEYPKVSSIFPTSSDTVAVIQHRRPRRGRQAGRPGRRAQHPCAAAVQRRPGRHRCRHRRRRPGQSEAVEATLTGPGDRDRLQPHLLLDGLGAVGTAYSRISFTQPSRPAVLSGQAEDDGEADTSYRYVLMPVRFAS